MKKFENIIICTDLDGTLLRGDKTISEENLDAIAHFQREGGYFTFITGRMPFFCHEIYHMINPNAPVGCINGGGLYDYTKEEYIWNAVLPREAGKLIDYVLGRFPTVGVQVNTHRKIYFHQNDTIMYWFRQLTGVPNLEKKWWDIEEDFAKIVFGIPDEETMTAVAECLASHPDASKYAFVQSEKTLYEILPKGIHKGCALEKLCEHLGVPIARTIAIGDYNNDIKMLRSSGIGVAVANAKPEVKAAADYITVSNEEHAIARVIEALEKGELVLPTA